MKTKNINIELATTSEIANELTNRDTFKGVIIFSREACKDGNNYRPKETYSICFNNNLETEEVINLLRAMADDMEERENEI